MDVDSLWCSECDSLLLLSSGSFPALCVWAVGQVEAGVPPPPPMNEWEPENSAFSALTHFTVAPVAPLMKYFCACLSLSGFNEALPPPL